MYEAFEYIPLKIQIVRGPNPHSNGYYDKSANYIFISDHVSEAHYPTVLFHEYMHATGHCRVLNRFTSGLGYDEEEYVAVLGEKMFADKYSLPMCYDFSYWDKKYKESLTDAQIVWCQDRAKEAFEYLTRGKHNV